MPYIYERFYKEIKDASGNITKLDISYDKNFNFAYDVVDAIAGESPDKKALVHRSTSGVRTVLTFGELKRLSDKAANALRNLGIGKGSPVMLLLKRRYEYWVLILALHKLGAVAIPTSHMVSSEDIRERIEVSKARAVICVNSETICDKVRDAVSESDTLQLVIGDKYPGAIDIWELTENASSEFERIPTFVTDDMLYYFTSGTSGSPKAVIHDHSYPLAHIYTAKNWHGMQDGDLHLTVADSGWAKSAWGKLYGQWFMGAAIMVYDYDNFYAADMLKLLEEEKVNTFCAPPTIYKYFLLEDLKSYDLSALKCVTTAGEPMPGEISDKFTEAVGIQIREGFGQTETALQIQKLFVAQPLQIGSVPYRFTVRSQLIDRVDDAADTHMRSLGREKVHVTGPVRNDRFFLTKDQRMIASGVTEAFLKTDRERRIAFSCRVANERKHQIQEDKQKNDQAEMQRIFTTKRKDLRSFLLRTCRTGSFVSVSCRRHFYILL